MNSSEVAAFKNSTFKSDYVPVQAERCTTLLSVILCDAFSKAVAAAGKCSMGMLCNKALRKLNS